MTSPVPDPGSVGTNSGTSTSETTGPSPDTSATNGGGGSSSSGASQPPPPKRTRVLLSCAPCRTSKLKCDRQQPCGQCVKKGRIDGCAYAPRRPENAKPPRSMAARLKRLEGMVRDMIDDEGSGARQPQPQQEQSQQQATASRAARGQVVVGPKGLGTTYVGATHFMAMLDDIEDLKSYFDDGDDECDDEDDGQE
jgi:hypothetical protein